MTLTSHTPSWLPDYFLPQPFNPYKNSSPFVCGHGEIRRAGLEKEGSGGDMSQMYPQSVAIFYDCDLTALGVAPNSRRNRREK